ncbi:MAG TPA: ABC transporter substrate-binding protein [Clostridia bacterium]|nr:ABC transporter substrate-binding protein [Clostridia bacterium]
MKQKTVKRITLLLAMVMMIALALGCTKSDAPKDYGVEVTDSIGRAITIEKKPEKVISMSPNNTETLFALGLGDKVVGVSTYCNYPEEATEKDKVGDFWEPNVELIVAADPDILFVGNAAPPEFIEKMEDNDIIVVALEGYDLDGTYQAILNTGKIMGVQDKADDLIGSMKAQVSEIEGKVKEADKIKAYFIISYGDQGDFTAGSGSFVDEIINIAGGENIAGDMDQPWAEYSIEKLIEKDPEIIFASINSGAETISDAPGYKELTAIKEGRIVIVDDDLVTRAGPRIVEGLEEIARAMHPDLFK